MITVQTRNALARSLDPLRSGGQSIGLVPTMGALHPGHLSLVKRSVGENDFTVVSIFVNPTQFNDPSDLEKYPRTPESDLGLLRHSGTGLVFMPAADQVYPEPDKRRFDLGGLDQTMEGAQRPGHFNGVAQVVSRLLELVQPTAAYFGQKDYQQLVIVRHLVAILNMDVRIEGCPIIREPDGLAMSSRNIRLDPAVRKEAPVIYRTLVEARKLMHTHSPSEVRSRAVEHLKRHPMVDLKYFEIVDGESLQPVVRWSDPGTKVACVAVEMGGVRLIDNLIFD